MIGFKHTAEAIEKIRQNAIGRPAHPNTIRATSNRLKKEWQNPEYRAKFERKQLIECKYCGQKTLHSPSIAKIRKFCDVICRSKFEKGKIKKKCPICQKEFESFFSQKRVCCNWVCQAQWLSIIYKERGFNQGENNPAYIHGLAHEPYDAKFTERLKQTIRKRDNNTCQNCGKLRSELSRELTVHHIFYDKKDSCPDHLISLCQSCHNLTLTNRDYWIQLFCEKRQIMVGVVQNR